MQPLRGKCCNFEKRRRKSARDDLCIEVSGRQIEQLVDELILFTNIIAAAPPRRPFSDHVHRFVSLNRSPGCLELTKVLLGLHSSFDGSVILLRILFKYWTGRCRQRRRRNSFLLYSWNRRPAKACLIGVDDSALWM